MRIIGGTYKGRIFHPGKRFKARPTTDLAKEGLFNILQNRYNFNEISVLDLFSGTGSISYEFASRGCKDITLIEQDHIHIQFINKVIEKLGISFIKTIKGNVFQYIQTSQKVYDIIFADPPYQLEHIKLIPELIFSSGLIKPNTLFILEHSQSYNFTDLSQFQEIRKYGSVHFSFFKVS